VVWPRLLEEYVRVLLCAVTVAVTVTVAAAQRRLRPCSPHVCARASAHTCTLVLSRASAHTCAREQVHTLALASKCTALRAQKALTHLQCRRPCCLSCDCHTPTAIRVRRCVSKTTDVARACRALPVK
jgi:hypothetical protein